MSIAWKTMWIWYRQPESTVVDECDAFLTGGYAEYATNTGKPVPNWAWLNLLAHGSLTDLERAECGETSPGGQQARAYLAAELVAYVHRGACLTELQCELLRPLEAEAIARGRAGAPISPADAVTEVVGSLTRHQARHRPISGSPAG